jgi:hypothetical protein
MENLGAPSLESGVSSTQEEEGKIISFIVTTSIN